MTPKVAVIGSGVVGLCAALYLQRAACEVVLIDPGDMRQAASFGNAGQFASTEIIPLAIPGILRKVPRWLLDSRGPLTIRPSYLIASMPWLLRLLGSSGRARVEQIVKARTALCAAGATDYEPLLEMTGSSDLIAQSHCLRVYQSRAEWPEQSLEWVLRRESGQKIKQVDRAGVQALEPEIADRFGFGICFEERHFVRNLASLMTRFKDEFQRRGGDLIVGSAVDFTREAGRVAGVELANGRQLSADYCVVAAGARSHALTRRLGDPVPLESERGYHVMVPGAQSLLRGTLVDAPSGIAMVPMEEGLRITGTVEFAGLNAPPDPRQARRLLDAATQFFPKLQAYHGRAGPLWMGHRPSLPDSLPIIDRATHFKNVFYAFGHNHMGLLWAATTGRLISELIGRCDPSIDIAPYRLSRFSGAAAHS